MTRITAATAALLLLPAAAGAQAWSYPSMQPPRLSVREFNFGVAHSRGPGTSLFFQWREESGPRHQLSFDVGLADADRPRSDLVAFFGGQLAWKAASAGDEVPLDFLMTAGAFLAVGDFTLLRFPLGLSVGHRFELDDGVALTPYLHPRVSFDLCNNCRGRSDVALSFDLGLNAELTQTVSLRAAALFAGGDSFDNDGFGVSIAWTPPALARRTARR